MVVQPRIILLTLRKILRYASSNLKFMHFNLGFSRNDGMFIQGTDAMVGDGFSPLPM